MVAFLSFCGGKLGVSAALKTNTFGWGNPGQFYLTMVALYVLTYAGLYAVDLFVPDLLGAFLDVALVVAAFGAITTNLLSSIGGHLVSLGLRRAQAQRPLTMRRAALW
jgi:hypothetical protein